MSLLGSLPAGDVAWLVGALVLGGVVTGILAGVFGVGGGAVIVPVLAEIFDRLDVAPDVQMHLAVGTSLAIIIPTSIRSYYSHRARGSVDVEALKTWLIPVPAGAIAGAAVAGYVPSDALKVVFVLFALGMSFNLLFGRDDWRLADRLPGKVMMAVWGFAIGALASLIGIGGGGIATIVLAAYGMTIHRAIGTSAGLSAVVALPAAAAYALTGLPHQAELPPLSIGYVSLLAAMVMAPVSVLAAPLGVKLAHGLSRRALRIAFGSFLGLVALRFVIDLLT